MSKWEIANALVDQDTQVGKQFLELCRKNNQRDWMKIYGIGKVSAETLVSVSKHLLEIPGSERHRIEDLKNKSRYMLRNLRGDGIFNLFEACINEVQKKLSAIEKGIKGELENVQLSIDLIRYHTYNLSLAARHSNDKVLLYRLQQAAEELAALTYQKLQELES